MKSFNLSILFPIFAHSYKYYKVQEIASDILENDILRRWPEVLETLLVDHTTHKNIIWATDMYVRDYGKEYAFDKEITIEQITGENGFVIRPRSVKTLEEQKYRIKDKAEVFTPSWICNAQNNLIDDAWFGRKNVFNVELVNETGQHDWSPTEEKIEFVKANDWMRYVHDTRLEITCGEAPYLASRYDAITGEIIPIKKRIGMLDRKLRVVGENTPNLSKEMNFMQRKIIRRNWIRAAYKAMQSVYGFEWQGDSLLIARETLLYTFIDYYQAKFNTEKAPEKDCLLKVAKIISWNLWQMDGLKYGIPGYTPKEHLPNELELNFQNTEEVKPYNRYCRIMEWNKIVEPVSGKEIPFVKLLNQEKIG